MPTKSPISAAPRRQDRPDRRSTPTPALPATRRSASSAAASARGVVDRPGYAQSGGVTTIAERADRQRLRLGLPHPAYRAPSRWLPATSCCGHGALERQAGASICGSRGSMVDGHRSRYPHRGTSSSLRRHSPKPNSRRPRAPATVAGRRKSMAHYYAGTADDDSCVGTAESDYIEGLDGDGTSARRSVLRFFRSRTRSSAVPGTTSSPSSVEPTRSTAARPGSAHHRLCGYLQPISS